MTRFASRLQQVCPPPPPPPLDGTFGRAMSSLASPSPVARLVAGRRSVASRLPRRAASPLAVRRANTTAADEDDENDENDDKPLETVVNDAALAAARAAETVGGQN